jgi:hypothetical protein
LIQVSEESFSFRSGRGARQSSLKKQCQPSPIVHLGIRYQTLSGFLRTLKYGRAVHQVQRLGRHNAIASLADNAGRIGKIE